MTDTQHAKILFFLAILAMLAILAPGVVVWILKAIVTLSIAGAILSLFFGLALLLSLVKK